MKQIIYSNLSHTLKKVLMVLTMLSLTLHLPMVTTAATDPMDGYITGMVYAYSGEQGVGIPGIEITLTGKSADGKDFVIKVVTDENGWYHFRNLPEGTYTIEVTGQLPPGATNRGPSKLGPFNLNHLPGNLSQITRTTSFGVNVLPCVSGGPVLCNGSPNSTPEWTNSDTGQPPANNTTPPEPPPPPPPPPEPEPDPCDVTKLGDCCSGRLPKSNHITIDCCRPPKLPNGSPSSSDCTNN